jgi:hypothetical protein
MIARIWHGWTLPANADAFQDLMCGTVIPAFEAREVAGLLQVDLLRRRDTGDGDGAVEFTTVMVFDTIAAIERFAGDDATLAQVPPAARALLARSDPRATHHEIIDRRVQPDHSRGRA